jgi:hypothetical protein
MFRHVVFPWPPQELFFSRAFRPSPETRFEIFKDFPFLEFTATGTLHPDASASQSKRLPALKTGGHYKTNCQRSMTIL